MSRHVHRTEVVPVYRVAATPIRGASRAYRLRVVAFRIFCPDCGYLSQQEYVSTRHAGTALGGHNRSREHRRRVAR